jgi:hypothetical protein
MFLFHQSYPMAEISRPKGLFRHTGVLLADGRVAHCAPARGEHISSVEEFAAGEDVSIDRELVPDEIQPVMHRIAEALRSPKAYDLLSNNCEMFVNRVFGRGPQSQQVTGAIVLMGVAAILGLASR